MKIILLSPPYLPEYMRNGRCDYVSWSDTQWYPIWLAYCGALLESQHGHLVQLIDAPAQRIGHKETFKRIADFSPELLIVYSSTQSQANDIAFAEKIKDSLGCSVVFVGPFVSIDAGAILRSSAKIDACVQGEFEYPVLELASGIEKGKIKNLVYRCGAEIIANETRPPLTTEELNALPFVTAFYQKHINLKNYNVPSELYPFVDLFTGRGCAWGRCTFCLWVHSFIKGAVYNTRSVENVIEEIRFVQEKIPAAKEVFFQDDTLPGWRAIEISQALLHNRLRINWSCYARADLDYATLKLMKEAGCRTLHVGYESKNNLILRNIAKGLTFEEMTEFTFHAKKAGLRIHGDFMLGLPGETEKSIQETIEWAKVMDPETAQFLTINLYPGTPLSNQLSKCQLTPEKIAQWVKKAYIQFYVRGSFIKRAILHPREYLFPRKRAICRMITHIAATKNG